MQLNTQFMWETFLHVLQGIPVTLIIVLVTLLFSVPFGFSMAVSRSGEGKIAKNHYSLRFPDPGDAGGAADSFSVQSAANRTELSD